jgi:hypothetical protein
MSYAPLHNLPALAGLTDFESARRPGLSVEESVRRLKRLHYALRRLHEILIARITAEPHSRLPVSVTTKKAAPKDGFRLTSNPVKHPGSLAPGPDGSCPDL